MVGLVPTMGALHAGHRSLIRRCREESDRTAVSIFVNPRQFGPGEDLHRYPRPLEADLALLGEEGVDVAFVPSEADMYPPGHATAVRLRSPLATSFEGAIRPGHLDGVCLVVTKLLAAARPDRLFLGEKDAQQCAVLRRLVSDLDLGAEVVVCGTVRDADGLAVSSRNSYLSAAERARALAIPAALGEVAARHHSGVREPGELRRAALARLEQGGLDVDYVAIVDPATFEEVVTAEPGSCCAIAARVGTTRLVDALSLGDWPTLAVCETTGVMALRDRSAEAG